MPVGTSKRHLFQKTERTTDIFVLQLAHPSGTQKKTTGVYDIATGAFILATGVFISSTGILNATGN